MIIGLERKAEIPIGSNSNSEESNGNQRRKLPQHLFKTSINTSRIYKRISTFNQLIAALRNTNHHPFTVLIRKSTESTQSTRKYIGILKKNRFTDYMTH